MLPDVLIFFSQVQGPGPL
ncbi:hypothetical protein MTR67_023924 [Solanum verrucosum]|uniref:Uncharacterized protein n=1 Tax=Solanum verrucosum TaxID=315347 RepID=A0AAF0QUF3_SOLVR|nr:hypothetical protein MTR67_023924 [Solanum verrucosum]